MVTTDIVTAHTKENAVDTLLGYMRPGVTTIKNVAEIGAGTDHTGPRRTHITVGVLYKVTHFNHSQMTDAQNIQNRLKKNKQIYDRIFMFGDVHGGTFCVIMDTETCSRRFVPLFIDVVAVGQPYVLLGLISESGGQLRTDMPVLCTRRAGVPLMTSMVPQLRTINMNEPDEGAETTFFIQHGRTVELWEIWLVGKGDIYPTTCSGKFCDRMNIFKKPTQVCGCFYNQSAANRSSVVLECHLRWNAIPNRKFEVTNNRSLRTTELFIDNPDLYETMSMQQRLSFTHTLSDAVLLAADYINTHGGFTVMGTCSRGEINDRSNEAERIAAVKCTWSVCYLQPTDLVVLQHEEYQNLKFKHVLTQNVEEVVPLQGVGEYIAVQPAAASRTPQAPPTPRGARKPAPQVVNGKKNSK